MLPDPQQLITYVPVRRLREAERWAAWTMLSGSLFVLMLILMAWRSPWFTIPAFLTTFTTLVYAQNWSYHRARG
jgi:hypothetical protein